MRFVSWALSGIAVAIAAAPSWEVTRQPGTGCWPPACSADQIPLATPVVSHGGRLIMVGDGAAPTSGYESSDGLQWRAFRHDARWGARYQASDVSFGGFLWRVAGFQQEGSSRTLRNDVWRSVDGRRWERVLDHAPWAARSRPHLVVFRDTLRLIGGEPNDGLVWATTDGKRWTSRPAAGLPRSSPQGVLVFRGALWLLGHGAWESAKNDVWKSVDGASWTRVSPAAQWPARTAAGFAVLGDRMWVVSGVFRTDAWSSTDGIHWEQSATPVPGPPRAANYGVVFNDALWIYGGKTGGLGGTGFWDGVVRLK